MYKVDMFFIIISFRVITSNPINKASVQCRITINNQDEFTEPQVLILKPDFEKQRQPFKYPTTNTGTIYLAHEEEILLACPGDENKFDVPKWRNKTEQIVTCSTSNEFEVENQKYEFDEFSCNDYPDPVLEITNDTCYSDYMDIIIGMRVRNLLIPQIRVCHDDANMATLYTYFTMTPSIKGYQRGFPRPLFSEGIFYNGTTKNLETLYAKTTQQKTMGKLLGSKELGTKYVSKRGGFFLSRGHLTAKADFIFGVQQRLTFYYINTAPQWQVFNNGNWNTLEEFTRKLSRDRNLELEIYTGTYDICMLPNINGTLTPLYLFVNENIFGIPIPKYFWKTVYNAKTLKGAAFIGVNNPYLFDNKTDVFCHDICNQLPWVRWQKRTVVRLGYGYCCDINDFRKTIDFLPEFTVTGLLV